MRILFVTFFVVIVDQVTKLLVKGISVHAIGLNIKGMFPGQKIPIISNLFNITFVENPGIAFGINLGTEFKLLVSLFTLFASIGLFYYLYKNRDKNLITRFSLALILGGAIGNLLDRLFYGLFYGYGSIFYGRVVDFLDFRIFNLFMFNKAVGSYIFNFADVAVTVGVIIFFFSVNTKKAAEKEMPEDLENYLADNKE